MQRSFQLIRFEVIGEPAQTLPKSVIKTQVVSN